MARKTYPVMAADTPRPLKLQGLRYNFEVWRRGDGWCVSIMLLPGSDELWETLEHPHRFPTEDAARRLVERIDRTGALDLRYWLWSPSVCSPFAYMHERPSTLATEYSNGRHA